MIEVSLLQKYVSDLDSTKMFKKHLFSLVIKPAGKYFNFLQKVLSLCHCKMYAFHLTLALYILVSITYPAE